MRKADASDSGQFEANDSPQQHGIYVDSEHNGLLSFLVDVGICGTIKISYYTISQDIDEHQCLEQLPNYCITTLYSSIPTYSS